MHKTALAVGSPKPTNLALLLYHHFDLPLFYSTDAARTLLSLVASENDQRVKTHVLEALRRDALEIVACLDMRNPGTTIKLSDWEGRLEERGEDSFFHDLRVCPETVLLLTAMKPTPLNLIIFRQRRPAFDKMMIALEYALGDDPLNSIPQSKIDGPLMCLNGSKQFVLVGGG